MCTLCPRSHRFRLALVFGYRECLATSPSETSLYAVSSGLPNSRASSVFHSVFVAQMSCNLTGFPIPCDFSNRKDCLARTPSRLRRRNSGNCEQVITPNPQLAMQIFPLAARVSHCATPPSRKNPQFSRPPRNSYTCTLPSQRLALWCRYPPLPLCFCLSPTASPPKPIRPASPSLASTPLPRAAFHNALKFLKAALSAVSARSPISFVHTALLAHRPARKQSSTQAARHAHRSTHK